MRITTLRLKNFKSHRDKTFKFTDGVNGIVGKNGAGKSSIIEAIQFLVTGDTDLPKEKVITVGESSGYVGGEFVLHGKTVNIERHLDSSKVTLTYGDKKLVKASEVAELWNELLQVDKHIFKNVIVAHQGSIPALYSGDQASREKVFQNIFRVPGTDKLRTLIWDNYLKKCPPPLPEEHVETLEAESRALQPTLDQLLSATAEATQLRLPKATYNAVVTRIQYVEKCIVAELQASTWAKEINTAEALLSVQEEQLLAMQAQLLGVDIQATDEALVSAKATKDALLLRNKLRVSLAEITAHLASARPRELLDAEHTAISEASSLLLASLAGLKESKKLTHIAIEKLGQVDGQVQCPTCGHKLENVEAHLAENNLLMIQLNGQEATQLADLKLLKASLQLLETERTNLYTWLIEVNQITTTLDQLPKEENTDLDLNIARLEKEKTKYSNLIRDIANSEKTTATKLGAVATLKAKKDGLPVYDGEGTPEEELIQMRETLDVDNAIEARVTKLRNESATLQATVSILHDRIKRSGNNQKSNAQREEYISILTTVYDAFHSTQFPRQLIQSYAAVVQEHLEEQTKKFAIPYHPTITDGFKIVMTDDDGNALPAVSGGQEVIIGLCLRLALHSMFSQSFPLLIIDEGTTHLDTENVALYFDAIRAIKNDGHISQVIIVDHNDKLAEVVDNVITA